MFYFDKGALIYQMSRIKLIKVISHIAIGIKSTLWPDVKISCVGDLGKKARLPIAEK